MKKSVKKEDEDDKNEKDDEKEYPEVENEEISKERG
jgi:hypothetical protein